MVLLQQITAMRPTTVAMWEAVAVAVCRRYPDARVTSRGVKDRFCKVLLRSFQEEQREKINKLVLLLVCCSVTE